MLKDGDEVLIKMNDKNIPARIVYADITGWKSQTKLIAVANDWSFAGAFRRDQLTMYCDDMEIHHTLARLDTEYGTSYTDYEVLDKFETIGEFLAKKLVRKCAEEKGFHDVLMNFDISILAESAIREWNELGGDRAYNPFDYPCREGMPEGDEEAETDYRTACIDAFMGCAERSLSYWKWVMEESVGLSDEKKEMLHHGVMPLVLEGDDWDTARKEMTPSILRDLCHDAFPISYRKLVEEGNVGEFVRTVRVTLEGMEALEDCARVSKGVSEGGILAAVSYALIKCSYANVPLNHLDEVERDYLMFKEVLESLRDIPGEPTCFYYGTDAERAEILSRVDAALSSLSPAVGNAPFTLAFRKMKTGIYDTSLLDMSNGGVYDRADGKGRTIPFTDFTKTC